MVVICQRKKVLSLSIGNTSNELIKPLSHYLAVTWHLLIKDKFVVLCDFSMGAGQLVGSSSNCRSAFYLPARLAPSQHSWASTQDNLTETLTASMHIRVIVIDVVRQPHQAPGLWAAGKTLLGPAKVLTCQLQGKRMLCNNSFLGDATQSRAQVCPCSSLERVRQHQHMKPCHVVLCPQSTVLSFGMLWVVAKMPGFQINKLQGFLDWETEATSSQGSVS